MDAVKAPVIAAGAIADARGMVAAFALGASAVQIGTAYLLCPEAATGAAHREALRSANDNSTALTNVFSGRPARGIVNRVMRDIGPMSDARRLPAGLGRSRAAAREGGKHGIGRFLAALGRAGRSARA